MYEQGRLVLSYNMNDEELKSQIELLRSKRREKQSDAPSSIDPIKRAKRVDEIIAGDKQAKDTSKKKDDGIFGVFTMQLILTILIAIVYFAVSAYEKQNKSSFDILSQLKPIISNDFSFGGSVYEAVGGWITYLNTIAPIDQPNDGQGGESGLTGSILPSNATLAPVIYTGSITYPLEKSTETSSYGFRKSPLTSSKEFHNALDIAAPEGTPIRAAADGVVIRSDVDSSLGSFIKIDHGNGFVTVYGHCSRLIAKEGMHIREGDIIAKVGSTGNSTGPHVHFGASLNGVYFDPSYLFSGTHCFDTQAR